jgi:membrane protein DedA with SNARE-associated domain
LLDVEVFNQWLNQHPEFSNLIIFGIAFLESLAIVGVLMPGWLLLVGVGVLIGTGVINYFEAALACFAGAVIGEAVSYYLGRHYQQQVRQWRLIKSHPNWLDNSEQFFERYGVASIALGRFVGPVRAFAPLLAGMSGMSQRLFHTTNLLSALVWAPVYLIPGIIVGAAIEIDAQQKWLLVTCLAILALSVWHISSQIKYKLSASHGPKPINLKLLLISSVSLVLVSLFLHQSAVGDTFVRLVQDVWHVIQSSIS